MLSNAKVDERLIDKSIKRIGDYVNGQVPLLWGCLECGHNWFARPAKIVNNETGCPVCNSKKRNQARRLGIDTFIKRAGAKHNNKYDYSEVQYVNAVTPVVIVCPTHGAFSQTPDSHLRGHGCSRCHFDNLRDTKEQFVKKARAIHGEVYSYDKFEYRGALFKSVILCPLHGEFLQKPNTHLAKRAGCPHCDVESRKGSYSAEYFDRNPEAKDKPGFLYVVRLNANDKSFIKVGVAIDVQQRIHHYYGMTGEILYTAPMSLYEAYTTEQHILFTLKPHKYYPSKKFDGYTECVKDKPEVLSTIQKLLANPL